MRNYDNVTKDKVIAYTFIPKFVTKSHAALNKQFSKYFRIIR